MKSQSVTQVNHHPQRTKHTHAISHTCIRHDFIHSKNRVRKLADGDHVDKFTTRTTDVPAKIHTLQEKYDATVTGRRRDVAALTLSHGATRSRETA